MRKSWRFVLWLGVAVVGAAVCASWWATSGFSVPLCHDARVSDHCSGYDIRA
jgi:uncharacterized protein YqiB (DUF1249 family)